MLAISNFISRFFKRTFELTQHKNAVIVLAVISVAESSFFPIPIPPDFLLLAMSFSTPSKALYYAFVCIACTLLGSVLGYILGYLAYDLFIKNMLIYFNYMDIFVKYQNYYNNYSVLALLIGGFLPIPYKIITLATGVLQTNFLLFLVITLVSKGIKFTALAMFSKYCSKLERSTIYKLLKYILISLILILISIIVFFIVYYCYD